MKPWLPLIAIVGAGLLIGLAGARLADPGATRAGEEATRQWEDSLGGPPSQNGYDPRGGRGSAVDAGDEFARPGSRPEFDWEAEFRPEDHLGFAPGPYAHDEDYFGEVVEAFAPLPGASGDDGAPATGPARGEAAQAALAAERAVRDAARTMGSGAPLPAPPVGSDANVTAAPEPAPAEPRTADGDLPAIW